MQSLTIPSLLSLNPPGLTAPRVLRNGLVIPVSRNAHVTATKGVRCGVVRAHRGDDVDGHENCNGRMVDKDIITLRLRIKEMSLKESEDELPLDWMEWERKYFEYFQKDVYVLIGLLQILLMNVRPCVALGFVAFFGFTVTTSVGLSLLHVVQAVKEMANGLSF